MNRTYSLKHWLATLFLSPFIPSFLYELASKPLQITAIGLLEVYPILIGFSIIFSIPTIIIYHLFFLLLIKKQINPALAKTLLIALSVIGVGITITMIGGSLSWTLIYSYSITAIITGIAIRIKVKEIDR